MSRGTQFLEHNGGMITPYGYLYTEFPKLADLNTITACCEVRFDLDHKQPVSLFFMVHDANPEYQMYCLMIFAEEPQLPGKFHWRDTRMHPTPDIVAAVNYEDERSAYMNVESHTLGTAKVEQISHYVLKILHPLVARHIIDGFNPDCVTPQIAICGFDRKTVRWLAWASGLSLMSALNEFGCLSHK